MSKLDNRTKVTTACCFGGCLARTLRGPLAAPLIAYYSTDAFPVLLIFFSRHEINAVVIGDVR